MLNLGLVAPEIAVITTAVLVVLLDLAVSRKGWLAGVSVAGLVVAAVFTLLLWGPTPRAAVNNMLAVDNFALFFKLILLGTAALITLASVDYTSKFAHFQGEYYALILLSTLGMMLMAAANELISLYVSLELTGISLYALVGFLKEPRSGEASLKYLLLGAIASAVLLYGMALVFGFSGTTRLGDIAGAVKQMSPVAFASLPALALGVVLLIAGLGFKIAAVPFQMWVPDVYEGAPTPITGYLSVASKTAGFAAILRVFSVAFGIPPWLGQEWGLVFAVLAVVGMTLGNVLAIPQGNIKRMLGYSSIAQAGYLMVGLATLGGSLATTDIGRSTILFFLASYAVTNIGAFAAIIAISNKLDSDKIDDYSGMIKRAPWLALALSLCLISLIGMPPAGGFIAKFYLFSAAVKYNLLWLVIIAVINSVISAYYYLRVVKVMWFGTPASEEKVPSSGALRLALGLSCLGVLVLGLVPGWAMALASLAARMLAS